MSEQPAARAAARTFVVRLVRDERGRITGLAREPASPDDWAAPLASLAELCAVLEVRFAVDDSTERGRRT